MTLHDDEMLDLLEGQRDPPLSRLLTQLNEAYAVAPPPPLGAAMDRAVERAVEHAVSAPLAIPATLTARRQSAPIPSRDRLPGALGQRRPVAPRRVLQLVAAVALVLTGLVTYLWLGSQPASAQAILSQAAAFHLAAGQAAHLTYQVTLFGGQKDGLTGTADVWIQANASGLPVASAQTLVAESSAKGPRPAGLVSRFVQDGPQVYAFDASHNAILLGAAARTYAAWIVPPESFYGVSVAQEVRALAAQSPQRVQVLTPRTLDGHPVEVLVVTGWTNRPAERTTFYFDQQTFLLRGFDIGSTKSSSDSSLARARLTTSDTLAASAVPAHTFTLQAPVGARAGLRELSLATFAALCHLPTVTKAQLHSTQQTPLALCQASVPGMTADALVAALAAPDLSQLDAAVAAGQLTPAQEADSLALLRTQLSRWLTSSISASQ
jgi:hypothetical protein